MATESTTLKHYYTMGFLSRTSIGMTISHEIEGRKKGRRSRPFFLPQYNATLVIPNEVRNLMSLLQI